MSNLITINFVIFTIRKPTSPLEKRHRSLI
jgi:hypothetical protein